MKQLSVNVLKEASKKLFFAIDETECQSLLKTFETILQKMEAIDQLAGIKTALPMVHPLDVKLSKLRSDIVKDVLSPDDVLRNAHDVVANQIMIPKVVK
ncbi:MAG: aspartyl/glutamyl-tRNA amidotransferase subunit C [Erysipelotrichaceae bacterium]|jgi:aspartyl/glutamyl-tRNA(Asn/Gln) amidotransferase C subunit|nr:aspartyl/glutamyl-tRNA amidotransferase subunit C [Erysipelotrichaceae bacterium]